MKKIKLPFIFSLIAFCSLSYYAWASGPVMQPTAYNIDHNLRSDSIDVLHYHINLSITSVVSHPISGYTNVTIVPKINGITTLNLDLLKFTIDSVKLNTNTLNFNYNDTLLKINLGAVYNMGDTLTVQVAYHGVPQVDQSGFGGFSFSSGYAYNLGVGFSADPHVYGRVWHPCFDNFVEHATYSFSIRTQNTHKAVCNGLLTGSIMNPDSTVTWNWEMTQSIPSYLACVAVAAYTTVHQNFSGINGNIPVELAAVPADTTNMKNSFVNLENAFNAFEEHFGPYRWSKVGYVLVPFNGGAMEHATNIAYPKVAVTSGSTLYEADLMAHELAHHWFGDLVTCKTAEDMWLNEGWASFAAYIFTESVYGTNAYKNALRSNQAKILQLAHIKEAGYRAVSGVPHEYTYGDHVYLKGASVAHNIRAYMGDSLFFNAVKYYTNKNAFKNVDSDMMRQDFEASSGLDLSDCFHDWVFNPGYAQFSIDSIQVSGTSGSYSVNVFIRQRITGAPGLFNNVPLELSFMNNNFQNEKVKVLVSGQNTMVNVMLPFYPDFAGINVDAILCDATVSQFKVIKNPGVVNFQDLKVSVNVSANTDSTFLFIAHNFATPDGNHQGYVLSPNRFYKIDGIFSSGFKATATVIYDGRSASASSNQFLDNMLFTGAFNEDSLVLLYRSKTNESWSEYLYYTKQAGNTADKFGTVKLDSILKGEYTFGMKAGFSQIRELKKNNEIIITPNPAHDFINLNLSTFSNSDNSIECNIYDAQGRWIKNYKIAQRKENYSLDIKYLRNGIYFFDFNDGYNHTTQKVIINK